MPTALDRSRLHVEGSDDKHTVIQLLIRHGVPYDQEPWPEELPVIENIGGVDALLAGVETAVMTSTGRAIGFVADANFPLRSRWQAVRDRLRRVGVDAPDSPPICGYVGTSARYRSRIGVWLMPDNQQDGSLESFIQTLVGETDPLIAHASAATDTALTLGATFGLPSRLKAVTHTWLAWQEEPGAPMERPSRHGTWAMIA
ncbi:MAG: hypothetical protein ISS72_09685 [Candidatus Brocadiae bacterium]|nr:hypothetical protein [Candidatus Brocadiia bacterium]